MGDVKTRLKRKAAAEGDRFPLARTMPALLQVWTFPNESGQAAEITVRPPGGEEPLIRFRVTRTDFHMNVRSVTLYRALLTAMPWWREVEAARPAPAPAPRRSEHGAALQRLAAQEKRAHAGDDDDEELLFDADVAWPDSDFIASVREQYEERRFITDAQRDALVNIINRRSGR